MSQLRFHRAAREELIAAATYYEAQRPGYGDKFEAEFDGVVERIEQFPESGGLLPGYPSTLRVRAFHFKTFRNSLIVATVDGVRIVYALVHHHRRPGYWKDRVK